MKLVPIDRYGWPVERIIGRPITNFLRILIHTRGAITEREWKRRESRRRNMGCDTNAVNASWQ